MSGKEVSSTFDSVSSVNMKARSLVKTSCLKQTGRKAGLIE